MFAAFCADGRRTAFGFQWKLRASVVLNTSNGNAINIISLGHGAVFLKFEYKGVPVFLSTSRKIIDLAAELTTQNFDVREHFLSAVPLVLYIKWAFAETCWNAPESNACLIIDDPLLKPTHGFIDFQELLSLMKRHKFSTNIAFIPWNWRRSAPEVVRLFKENPGDVTRSRSTAAIIHGQNSAAPVSNGFIGKLSKRSSG